MTAGAFSIAIPDTLIEDIAQVIAARAFELLKDRLNGDTPWMTTEEAAAYTRIRPGTFAKLAARGAIPSHSDGGSGTCITAPSWTSISGTLVARRRGRRRER